MAASRHVLILGGHGKVSQLLTPLLLKRSWTVTSVIRAQDQVPTIEKLGAGQPGKLNVLVRSIEDITSQEQAASILTEVKPDYIAFSAGAGGKGAPERTFKIDRDAAIHFVNAAAAIPSITRFMIVSYVGSRRKGAPWWEDGVWDEYHKNTNLGYFPNYYHSKLAADEALYEASKKSSTLVGISLRPGFLTTEPAGKVLLGRTPLKGVASRASVARTADALLAADGVKNCWLDLLDGEDEIEQAVQQAVKEGVDAAVGEPVYEG
ncbi:NAD dependent epimerase/dehydratase family protein [Stachybotrys elegans]|uniref:NAD dependent epimerase/dehydratase family protein n=1 Tax=Stachybotrys elegans TaxID=80388 RepID=A0A8K0SHL3_9HYPO|nr:NAD dependent epimerase/dehydratase family protein [Stachybotrys elegans]